MATKVTELTAIPRTELGKGPSRRARKEGRVPGVIYAAHQEPVHITVDRLELTAVIRAHGVNAVVDIDVDGEQHLAMVKHIDQNVLTLLIDHIDFLAIKRGEKVEVDVPVVLTGEVAPGGIHFQEYDVLHVEADALNIPEEIEVSVEGLEIGAQITAGDITLPEGVTLAEEADKLIVNVIAPETEAETEETAEGEGKAPAEAADDEAASEE
ncbi:MAG: 50S ribosomal protein L25/general stress protein Ctc [Corynebacterium sp.]|nr:50S ribosomal protein L25/general stress protein Ctc [Corynebacterium sp.]